MMNVGLESMAAISEILHFVPWVGWKGLSESRF
jgi:hypothetical protein